MQPYQTHSQFKRFCCFPIFFLLIVYSVDGAVETLSNRIEGATIVANKTFIVQDDQLSLTGFTNKSSIARVIFGINQEQLNYISTSFTCTVNVDITYYDDNGSNP